MEDNFKVPTINILPAKKKKLSSSIEMSPQHPNQSQPQSEDSSSNIPNEFDQQLEQHNKRLMEIRKRTTPPCPYVEPKWSDKPLAEYAYKFEVIKNGVIIEYISALQTKSHWRIGKLITNDIQLEHPTISRYHAVLQYRPDIIKNDSTDNEMEKNTTTSTANNVEKGWYLYDLNSTHGCFVNNMKVPANTYVRVRVGYILKFGCSTRHYLFQGPEFDEDMRFELKPNEIIELKRKMEADHLVKVNAVADKVAATKTTTKQIGQEDSDGINWGMDEDADEETDLSVNPYAITNNEELFIEDPKKTLRGFYERDGLECEYKCDEISIGTFVCKVELPLNDSNGRPIIAEACHKGKKKDCVIQCALEACRILDRHGVLRQANHEPFRRPKPKSDSDDDDFLDRTGVIERKRLKKLNSNNTQQAYTYEELLVKEKTLLDEYNEIQKIITNHQQQEMKSKQSKSQPSTNDENQDLDDFMANLSEGARKYDKMDIRKFRNQAEQITQDRNKLLRLIEIAKPVSLPPIQTSTTTSNENDSNVKSKKLLPLFGKRNSKNRYALNAPTTSKVSSSSEVGIAATSAIVPSKTDVIEEIEEFDEVEQTVVDTMDNLKTNVRKEIVSEKQSSIESTSQEENVVTLKDTNKLDCVELKGNTKSSSNETSIEIDSTSQQQKKKRNRPRIRNEKSRENVDETEEIYDKEKVSEWLPPENQSGDGTTNLNSKYGY